MFEFVLEIIIRILTNLALLGSLVTGLFTIAALALASVTEHEGGVEIVEFDPETLYARRRRLRVLPVQHEEGVHPHTPPAENQPLNPHPYLRPRNIPVDRHTPSPIEVQVHPENQEQQ